MFEIFRYEKHLRNGEPSASPSQSYEPSALNDVAQMSFLLWGEHCVECAAPDCYSTCELYQARPDLRCRRLTYGMYKNEAFACMHRHGAEMSFKKWAKIEARGNTRMETPASVGRKARLIETGVPVIDAIGSLMHRLTGDIRWSYASHALLERYCRALHRRRNGSAGPEAFLLEVYNPTPQPIQMQLAMRRTRTKQTQVMQLTPSFVTSVVFPPGYSRHEFERRLFQAVTEDSAPFDVSLTPVADETARLVLLSADFVTFKKRPQPETAAGPAGKNIKCVVWDLDNTIWNGILLENDDTRLRPGITELLKQLDERGVLHSIASRNDFAAAWARVEQLGISEYFLYPQISWAPKSESLKTIAKRLNIGLDTFAFIDDDPAQLEQVAQVLPMVTCINAGDIAGISSDPRFAGSNSAEARQRRRMYKDAMEREQKQEEFGDDYIAFLSHCNIKLEIRPFQDSDLERVSELVQRTNQLNFSGRKYTSEALTPILADPAKQKYVLNCSDRYGDYGTVGFCIFHGNQEAICIEDLMLSCRVQGKLIEQAFFAHLQEHHNPDHVARMWVNFTETARNKPARQVLETMQFHKADGEAGLSRTLASPICEQRFIDVSCLAEASQAASH